MEIYRDTQAILTAAASHQDPELRRLILNRIELSTVSQRDGTLGLFDQDTRWTDGLLHQAT
jgi:hypothetical protein